MTAVKVYGWMAAAVSVLAIVGFFHVRTRSTRPFEEGARAWLVVVEMKDATVVCHRDGLCDVVPPAPRAPFRLDCLPIPCRLADQ